MSSQFPLARTTDLVVREVGDEVLVYDLVHHNAFCLNRLAGAVWKLSDGRSPVGQIAQAVSRQLGATIPESVVWPVIHQLGRDHLLAYCIPVPSSRRQHLRSLGTAAAATIPVVASLSVPKAAEAASCIPQGSLCSPGGPPCCKGSCHRPANGNPAFRCTGN